MISKILSNIHIFGYALALGIIGYLLINPRVEHVPIEYEENKEKRDTVEVTETKVDTVTVRDTVVVEMEVPEPEETSKGLNKYTTEYSDKWIKAFVVSHVDGTLEYQQLEYIRKIWEIHTDQLTEREITKYMEPVEVYDTPDHMKYKGVWGGLDVDYIGDEFSLTPNISYIRGNVSYGLGYNVTHKYPRFKIQFKIF